MKSLRVKYIYSAGMLVIILLATEGTLRLMGYNPLASKMSKNKTSTITAIKPQSCFKSDSLIGYSLKPGSYTYVYASGYSFTATHTKNGNRITKSKWNAIRKAPRVHIYGDSYFYGFGLNDTATLGWKLQYLMPEYNIVNRAVMGHSAVSSLLRLSHDIKSGRKPAVAVILLTQNDIRRCVLTKHMKRDIHINRNSKARYSYPYVQPGKEFTIKLTPLEKYRFRLSCYSSVVNIIETAYYDYDLKKTNNKKVFRTVIDEILSLCDANDVTPVIAAMGNGAVVQQMCMDIKEDGVEVVDLSDLLKDKYTLLPYDRHPNGEANSIYAERLYGVLDSTLQTTTF